MEKLALYTEDQSDSSSSETSGPVKKKARITPTPETVNAKKTAVPGKPTHTNSLKVYSEDSIVEARKRSSLSLASSSTPSGSQVVIRKHAHIKEQGKNGATHSHVHARAHISETLPGSQQPGPAAPTETEEVPEADEISTIRSLLRPLEIDGLQNWGIPPDVLKPHDPVIEEKLAQFHSLKTSKTNPKHFNDSLMSNRSFRNPHLYAKLVEFVEVDEKSSNFSLAHFPNHEQDSSWSWNDFSGGQLDTIDGWDAEEIAKYQKTRYEEQASASKAGKRSQIAFTTSTRDTETQSQEHDIEPAPRILGGGRKQSRHLLQSSDTYGRRGGMLYSSEYTKGRSHKKP